MSKQELDELWVDYLFKKDEFHLNALEADWGNSLKAFKRSGIEGIKRKLDVADFSHYAYDGSWGSCCVSHAFMQSLSPDQIEDLISQLIQTLLECEDLPSEIVTESFPGIIHRVGFNIEQTHLYSLIMRYLE